MLRLPGVSGRAGFSCGPAPGKTGTAPVAEAGRLRRMSKGVTGLQAEEVLMVDPQAYRDAMSEIASPVHVIATDGPAGLAGMTVTALASISDHPPTLLVCVNRSSPSAPRFLENAVFSVNSLGAEDRLLADIFAGRTNRAFCREIHPRLMAKGPHGRAPARKRARQFRLPAGRREGCRHAPHLHRPGRSGRPSRRRSEPALSPPRLPPQR